MLSRSDNKVLGTVDNTFYPQGKKAVEILVSKSNLTKVCHEKKNQIVTSFHLAGNGSYFGPLTERGGLARERPGGPHVGLIRDHPPF